MQATSFQILLTVVQSYWGATLRNCMAKSTVPAASVLEWSKTAGIDVPPPMQAGPSSDRERRLVDDRRTFRLMPEPAEQTAETLRPESERRAMAALNQAHRTTPVPIRPMLDFLAMDRMPPPPPALAQAMPGASGLPAAPSNSALMGASALPSGRRRVAKPAASAEGSALRPPDESSSSGLSSTAPVLVPKKKRKKKRRTKQAAMLATLGGDSGQDGQLFGDVIPLEEHITAFSGFLSRPPGSRGLTAASMAAAADAQRTGVRQRQLPQLGTLARGPIGGYKHGAQEGTTVDYKRLFEEFFARDTFGLYADARPARGADVSTFPPVRELVAALGRTSLRHMLEEGVVDRYVPSSTGFTASRIV